MIKVVRAFVFVIVCAGVFLGGIFALPIMVDRWGVQGGPTVDFWLLFGGGAAALGTPILLAREFGYIPKHGEERKTLPEAAPPEASRDTYAQDVRRDAMTRFALRGEHKVS
jgi:hypothetical protein